jgi:hypothetical protein
MPRRFSVGSASGQRITRLSQPKNGRPAASCRSVEITVPATTRRSHLRFKAVAQPVEVTRGSSTHLGGLVSRPPKTGGVRRLLAGVQCKLWYCQVDTGGAE